MIGKNFNLRQIRHVLIKMYESVVLLLIFNFYFEITKTTMCVIEALV
jgi:hypothetical protein